MKAEKEILDILKRIQALAENPHWTSDRRWTIAELAGKGLSTVATAKMDEDLNSTVLDIAKRFLRYSFDGVEYLWANLTEQEKTFANEEEYQKLVKWIRS